MSDNVQEGELFVEFMLCGDNFVLARQTYCFPGDPSETYKQGTFKGTGGGSVYLDFGFTPDSIKVEPY
jgi:hypothetical protein